MAANGNYRYSRNDDEVMALVAAEIARLAAADAKGRAPSRVLWDVRRDKAVPCSSYLIARFNLSWSEIVRRTGHEVKRKTPVRRDLDALTMAETLSQHVTAGAEPANWMDRFDNRLYATHELPRRVEVAEGRTIGGQPCNIVRTYWMVR